MAPLPFRGTWRYAARAFCGDGDYLVTTARQWYSACGRSLRAALTVVALGFASAVSAESAVRSIEVQPAGEGFVVDLVMWAPVPRELAFEVLVDFDHVSNWTPSVHQSRVLKREPNRVTVEYQGSVRLGAVTVPYTTVREVEFAPSASIESTQIKGTMKRHRSRISLAHEGAGTRVDYHLEMAPSSMAAALVNKARLEQELRETFEAVAREMIRRQPAVAPAAR